MAAIVELRIHGVGGGTAQDLLGDDVVPIGDAADDLAGFWEDPKPVGDPPRTRQVYSWGGFSGRNASRALWMLLLPFTVVNLAGWMVDPAAGPRLTTAQRGLVRIIAFLQTVLLMVWMASIAFDALGAQPLGHRLALAAGVSAMVLVAITVASERSSRYEEFGTTAEADHDEGATVADDDLGLADPEFWRTAPVIEALRRSELAVAASTVAFVPALSLWRATESTVSLVLGIAAILVAAAALAIGLTHHAGPNATRLSWVGAAVMVASLVVAWLADLPGPSTALDGMWATAPLWILLVAGLLVVVLAAVECLAWRRRGGDVVVRGSGLTAGRLRLLPILSSLAVAVLVVAQADGTITPTGFWAILVGSAAVAVPATMVLLVSRRTSAGVLSAMAAAVTGLIAASVNEVWWLGVGVAVAVFTVTAFAETGRRDRFRWLPVVTVSALALLLLAVTGSGLAWIIDWIIDWGPGSGTPLPTGFGWITAVFTGAVIAAALGGFVHLLHRRLEAWPVARVTKEYWGQAEPCRTTMATKAGRRRAVADLAGNLDVVITVVVWVAGLTLLIGLVRVGRPAMELWSLDRLHVALAANPWPESWSWLAAVGAWLGALFPVLAVAALLLSIRYGAIRRKVGVVWDVGTFWPRRFHPLAPPAYAERAIPELDRHITELAKEKGVVIVGHSQGSVLALAAALQLGGVDPARLAALTHGAPVGRYYRRFWPAVFGGGIAAGVAASWGEGGRGERFWNVYRLSDPIGGPLFTGPDEQIGRPPTDLCLPDPRAALTGCPGPKGHMGHLSDPVVKVKLDELGAAVAP